MDKKLVYMTYQSFPAQTANSIQTMTHIKYFSKLGYAVSLIFPLRNKESNANCNILQKFYEFTNPFTPIGTIHPLPFKKLQFMEKIMYIISHFLWSYFTVRKYVKLNRGSYFFTRSEWIFYFLSKHNEKVIYECHQLSKIKKILIKSSIKETDSKIIFVNPHMIKDLGLTEDSKVKVLPSAFDEEVFFNSNATPKTNRIIYAGSINRFGKSRGIDSLIADLSKLNNSEFQFVIASNDDLSTELKSLINSKELNIEYHQNLSRTALSELYNSCTIGLLINNKSEHAERFTSPLKYFEYIASGLKVVASDSKSHRLLPYQESIDYFDSSSISSFIDTVNKAINSKQPTYNEIQRHTMNQRVSSILNFY